jgi:2'-5' RNA ligase
MADASQQQQGFAVLCYFDKKSEDQFDYLWRKHEEELGYDAGLRGVDARPHLTLASYSASCNVSHVRSILKHFAQTTRLFYLGFDAVGSFSGTEGVVFLSPVDNARLLEIHLEYHAAVGIVVDESPYTQVGKWSPHCTVGFRLSPDHIALTKEYFRNHLHEIGKVCVESVALISYFPHCVIDCFALSKKVQPRQ